MAKKQSFYQLTLYSQIDRSVVESHQFGTAIEARVAKIKLANKARKELCEIEIEEVYDD